MRLVRLSTFAAAALLVVACGNDPDAEFGALPSNGDAEESTEPSDDDAVEVVAEDNEEEEEAASLGVPYDTITFSSPPSEAYDEVARWNNAVVTALNDRSIADDEPAEGRARELLEVLAASDVALSDPGEYDAVARNVEADGDSVVVDVCALHPLPDVDGAPSAGSWVRSFVTFNEEGVATDVDGYQWVSDPDESAVPCATPSVIEDADATIAEAFDGWVQNVDEQGEQFLEESPLFAGGTETHAALNGFSELFANAPEGYSMRRDLQITAFRHDQTLNGSVAVQLCLHGEWGLYNDEDGSAGAAVDEEAGFMPMEVTVDLGSDPMQLLGSAVPEGTCVPEVAP